MTGYGKSTATVNGKKIRVEIKSLNSKALDLSVRVAPIYREKEMEIRSMVSQALERGKVELNIIAEKEDEQAATPINAAILEGYYRQIQDISTTRHIPMPEDVFSILMRLPDVMTRTDAEELDETEWTVVRKTVEEAIAQLVESALQKKFTEKINNISTLLKSIEPYEQGRTERIRQKLLEALAAIPEAEYDRNRLEQEMIYYIEKLDINEEKQRLANHMKYFMETMENGHGQGKKLGFIAQEMGREINTTGSKSNQAEMQNIVVRMKDELEQIKEQVLNVM